MQRDSVFPVTLISLGVVWLLFNLNWVPSFDWVVTLVLVAAGVGILLLEGLTRKSVVGGPVLIALGIAWWLHFYYYVHWRYLAPSLVIIVGGLMLLARLPSLPDRRGPRSSDPG